MSKKTFTIKVCKDNECDKNPTEPLEIGNEWYIYCCIKGFEKSLKDFTEWLKNSKQKSDECIQPNDKTF